MARLTGSLHTADEEFGAKLTMMLRAASVPVSVGDDEVGPSGAADVMFVDGRFDLSSSMEAVEHLRSSAPAAAIFVMASEASPEVILRAMRAGANEFFAWPPSRDALDEALQRTIARRASSPLSRPESNTLVFFGAKGGAGTTTLAVNTGVEIARLTRRPTLIVDLKAGLGEVTLFLGVRSGYTLIDALDNLHRLDDEFLRELVVKHKSGLEILAGSDSFDRPGPSDSGALEEVLRVLGRRYEYVVIDAGSQMGVCAVSALYSGDTICLVANPDVPSVRNAQRLLDRVGQLGASSDRIRVLLNRAAEPYPIPLAQIQNALGQPIYQTFTSDYKAVSMALNTGVPLAMAGNTDLAAELDGFTRRLLDPSAAVEKPAARRGSRGLERLASLW